MPPKRKPAASAAPAPAKKERQSKLAKEHGITAREELEIREAFALFSEDSTATTTTTNTSSKKGSGGGGGGGGGVIPTSDVGRAMAALGLPPASRAELAEFESILDPDEEGVSPYEPFVAICALKLHARAAEGDRDYSDLHRAEVDEAFRLFVTGGNSGGGADDGAEHRDTALTLSHLKRVAMALKQDVDEALLRDMILEANGGAGVGKGVARHEFEEVMRRAGAWK